MLQSIKWIRLVITFFFVLAMSSAGADTIENYRLSVDDEISVSVFNEPDLNIDRVRVSASGTISMPLLGQVSVAELTVSELEEKLTKLFLGGYLKKPNVTVLITEYRPFYIDGQVNNPGSYPYRQGLTVQKAVTIAGGFTDRASKSGVTIINESTQAKKTGVSLEALVKPGDLITVDDSFF